MIQIKPGRAHYEYLYDGEWLTAADVAKRCGITRQGAQARLVRHGAPRRDIQTKVQKAQELGMSRQTLWYRGKKNIPLDTPVIKRVPDPKPTREKLQTVKVMWCRQVQPTHSRSGREKNRRLRKRIAKHTGVSDRWIDFVIENTKTTVAAREFAIMPLPKGLKEIQQEKRKREMGQACG